MIGRCLALGRLLAEFSLSPGTPSFLGQNAARKVVGRWPGSSLAHMRTTYREALIRPTRPLEPQENLRNS